jgi:small subunit ribosomal protein S10
MKFRIFLKSFDDELINCASEQLRTSLLKTDSQLTGIVHLQIKVKKFCVLRSPHIDKDSREHFEVRVHKLFMDLDTNSSLALDTLLKTQVAAGVSCSLTILSY